MPAAIAALFDEASRLLLTRTAVGAPWSPLPAEPPPVLPADLGVESPTSLVPLGEVPPAAASETARPVRAAHLDGRFPAHWPAGAESAARWSAWSIETLGRARAERPADFAPEVGPLLDLVQREALRLPYLHLGEHDYIYRFRTERERNRGVYQPDPSAAALYASRLCEAIKAVKRTKERTATSPAWLDFGPVRYVLPSHFGFCLGVQNAIERAYETLALHPGRRIFMLSELIHNPFVNEDLALRGLHYLQTDKGQHLIDPSTGRTYWEGLSAEDIVIIPAFGATDEDKRRLIEKGLPLNRYDATCMLVEKVWKAARRFAQEGWTVLIHGKAEHEETKATFSNAARHGPCFVIRNRTEAERLGEVLLLSDPTARRTRFAALGVPHTSGFDAGVHLDRLAVVNQTTLLRNETLGIIEHLESVLAARHGAEAVAAHLHPRSRGDTLCYATQVNQDALDKALGRPDIDAALVVGGRNSSNTFQLYRLCQARFGSRAHYIQSERNLLSPDRVQHFHFPYEKGDPKHGRTEERDFLPAKRPVTVLITGGASCPDGIIQAVIERINGFHPAESLRPVEAVLAEVAATP